MNENMKKVIAFLFQRTGKEEVTYEELIFSASMDMKWGSPQEVRMVIEKCLTDGLLIKGEGGLKPSFDYRKISIPLNFKPNFSSDYVNDIFMDIVDTITSATGMEKREVIALINKKKERMPASIEVIALLVAREKNVDISSFIKKVEDALPTKIN